LNTARAFSQPLASHNQLYIARCRHYIELGRPCGFSRALGSWSGFPIYAAFYVSLQTPPPSFVTPIPPVVSLASQSLQTRPLLPATEKRKRLSTGRSSWYNYVVRITRLPVVVRPVVEKIKAASILPPTKLSCGSVDVFDTLRNGKSTKGNAPRSNPWHPFFPYPSFARALSESTSSPSFGKSQRAPPIVLRLSRHWLLQFQYRRPSESYNSYGYSEVSRPANNSRPIRPYVRNELYNRYIAQHKKL